MDAAEAVLATSPTDPDTDNDGVLDGAEVDAGTDPLDGLPAIMGIIASVDTPGSAVDVCAVNDIAAVADSQSGVSLFSVPAGRNPVAIARVDTPGSAQRVACAGDTLAVADGDSGLALVDVTDPPAASVVAQLDLGGPATAVVAAGGLAFVGLASGPGTVAVVDLATRTLLRVLPIVQPISDLALGGDYLYALSANTLHAVRLQDLVVTGSAVSAHPAGPNTRLFVGGGIAYATQGKGYNTFSLAVPGAPALIQASDTTQFGWKQTVANGSGLGVAVVGPNSTEDAARNVSLYDVSDPSQTDVFLNQFETPGVAQAVSIYNGLAYVADGASGMHVVNYLSYDANGVPPTITLETNFALGLVGEGQQSRLTASVGDDVQVRNVEFFVGGQKVATDGNFPFEYRFVAPLLSQQAVITMTARATDTGGNAASTPLMTLTIVADATAPVVTGTSPAAGASLGTHFGLQAVSASFSEPISVTTLTTSSVQVFTPGPDTVLGTGDDVLVTGGSLAYYEDLKTAILSFGAPLAVGNYRAVVSSGVEDYKGNNLAADHAWTFSVVPTVYWDGGGDGTSWSQAANWAGDVLPGSGNAVVIDTPITATVTFAGISASPVSLLCAGSLVVNSGTLSLAKASGVMTMTMNGGTLTGAGSVAVNGPFVWNGGTWSGGGTTTFNGASTLSTGAAKSVQRAMVNNGAMRVVSGPGPSVAGGVVFTNNPGASFTTQLAGAVLSGGTFNNLGTFQKITDTGQADISGTAFNNGGLVEVQAGTLALLGGSGTQTGPFNAAGNTLVLGSGNYTFNAGADITAKDLSHLNGVVTVNSVLNVTNSLTTAGTVCCGHGFTINTPPANIGLTVTVNSVWNTLALNYPSQTFNTLTVNGGVVAGDANHNVTGAFNWNTGTLGGNGVTTMNAPLNLIGGDRNLNRHLVNNQQATQTSGGRTIIGAASRLTNSVGATYTLQSTGGIQGGTFTNLGLLEKTTNTGQADINGTTFTNSGTVEVKAGTLALLSGSGTQTGPFNAAGNTLVLSSGNYTFDAGADITAKDLSHTNGVVTVNSVLNVTNSLTTAGTVCCGHALVINTPPANIGPTVNVNNGWGNLTLNYLSQTFNTLNINGGTVAGDAHHTVAGAFNWNTGALGGNGVTTVNAPLSYIGGDRNLNRHLVNNQQATQTSGGRTIIGAASRLTNSVGATYTLQSTGGIQGGTFTNLGLLEKTTNTGQADINGTTFTNGGTVEVKAGTLALLGGSGTQTGPFNAAGNTLVLSSGNYTFNAGADITAKDLSHTNGLVTVNSVLNVTNSLTTAGTVCCGHSLVINTAPTNIGATVNVNGGWGNLTLNHPSQTFGVLNLNGATVTGDAHHTIAGTFNWNTGALGGNGVTTVNGPLNFIGSDRNLNRHLVNNQQATQSSGGRTIMGAAVRLTNSVGATYTLQSTGGIQGGIFSNSGTFQKVTDAGQADVNGTVFTSDGAVEAKAGTLRYLGQNLAQSAGFTSLAGGNLAFLSGASLQLNGGDVVGAGTITGNVTNSSGRALPGGELSPGIITLAGSYTQQPTGTLKVDIGGLTAGTQYDRLALPSHAATLTGTLEITVTGGFTPTLGNTFDILTYGSRSGVFGTVLGTLIPGGNQFQLNYLTNTLQLLVVP